MLPRLLSGLRLQGALGGHWACGASCRTAASGFRSRTTDGTEVYNKDVEEREAAEELKALLREELRHRKVIKFQRVRRQMTPPGPPLRRLTWDAIQQIRYLKQELPEEWTLERLAEGFSVSHDVIARVLRSKFVPPAERRMRQDAKAMSAAGQKALLPVLGSGETHVGLLGGAKKMLAQGNRGTALTLVGGLDAVAVASHHPKRLNSRPSTAVSYEQQSPLPNTKRQPPTVPESTTTGTKVLVGGGTGEQEQQRWDGTVLPDLQLEELAEQHKAHPWQDTVIRKGQEVFDRNGNFLYRICVISS